jgi:hypothetical protein
VLVEFTGTVGQLNQPLHNFRAQVSRPRKVG